MASNQLSLIGYMDAAELDYQPSRLVAYELQSDGWKVRAGGERDAILATKRGHTIWVEAADHPEQVEHFVESFIDDECSEEWIRNLVRLFTEYPPEEVDAAVERVVR